MSDSASMVAVDPSRWRRRGPSLAFGWDPRSFNDEDIRAFWRFRLRHVDLKPDTDREQDWAAFAGFVRGADDAWVWVRDGVVVGTLFHRHAQTTVDGRGYRVTFSEYGYSARRGHVQVVVGPAAVYVRRWLGDPRSPLYFGGFVYPHGYLPYARSLPSQWLLGDPAMPDEERRLAEVMAREWGGTRWDPERRIYTFATLPREPVPCPTTAQRRQLLAHYERLNPRWSAGEGLFLLGRIDLRGLTAVLAAMLRRGWAFRR